MFETERNEEKRKVNSFTAFDCKHCIFGAFDYISRKWEGGCGGCTRLECKDTYIETDNCENAFRENIGKD